MTKILSAVIIAGIFIAGCAHTGVVKETDESQQQKQIPATDREQIKDNRAAIKESQGTVTSKESTNTPPVNSVRLLKEMQAKISDIHFDFDKYIIRNDDNPRLKKVAETVMKNGNLKVTIEGNCDARGTTEYNLALGDRRAKAAKDYLLSLGVPSSRMDTISYGQEKPLCTENNETCWASNRRDHFVLDESKH
jgi:peptidoglycan-associated lipoprotein